MFSVVNGKAPFPQTVCLNKAIIVCNYYIFFRLNAIQSELEGWTLAFSAKRYRKLPLKVQWNSLVGSWDAWHPSSAYSRQFVLAPAGPRDCSLSPLPAEMHIWCQEAEPSLAPVQTRALQPVTQTGQFFYNTGSYLRSQSRAQKAGCYLAASAMGSMKICVTGKDNWDFCSVLTEKEQFITTWN